jgi:hypothetical protein
MVQTEFGYNELGCNELGYNELGYIELGCWRTLDYNEPILWRICYFTTQINPVITNPGLNKNRRSQAAR